MVQTERLRQAESPNQAMWWTFILWMLTVLRFQSASNTDAFELLTSFMNEASRKSQTRQCDLRFQPASNPDAFELFDLVYELFNNWEPNKSFWLELESSQFWTKASTEHKYLKRIFGVRFLCPNNVLNRYDYHSRASSLTCCIEPCFIAFMFESRPSSLFSPLHRFNEDQNSSCYCWINTFSSVQYQVYWQKSKGESKYPR